MNVNDMHADKTSPYLKYVLWKLIEILIKAFLLSFLKNNFFFADMNKTEQKYKVHLRKIGNIRDYTGP